MTNLRIDEKESQVVAAVRQFWKCVSGQESHAILKGGKIQGRYPGSPGWYGGKVANLIDENIPIKI